MVDAQGRVCLAISVPLPLPALANCVCGTFPQLASLLPAIVPFQLARSESDDGASVVGIAAIVLSIAGLMVKQKALSLIGLLFAIDATLNSRHSDSESKGYQSLMFVFMGLVMTYTQDYQKYLSANKQ
ncbi:uncharacterized protein BJ171DRAFT_496304 [Polychytrium aggregatum]|uniref:uncharacterized protein n=1 Tax=Polychytrium aggregatum TaxID=110093 RepID=UPI0022FEC7E8|nr:uncharacterized protein BJ171DRAFT_496304 [Polychytrium aggregatum]KAI9206601.1 hypothetical protein BJ171DRAFT_496304 [Polychytrium aggregatum]